MAKSDSGVFQLSLAELAFMLVFVLLLLLGWMIFKFEQDKKQFENQIADAADINASLIMLEDAKTKLSNALRQNGTVNPDEIISDLISKKEIAHEREVLRKRIEDLDAQLTMLAEVKEILDEANKQFKDKKRVTEEHIESALIFDALFKEQLEKTSSIKEPGKGLVKANLAKEAAVGLALKDSIEKELRTTIKQGMEAELVRELVEAAKQLRTAREASGSTKNIAKENADLRGQVAFLKGKLEARGGRDYPPCWAEETTGKVEFLFQIEIHPDGLVVSPVWPINREQDARMLPNIDQLLVQDPLTLTEFKRLMQGIDRQSKEKNCRHYILMRNHVNELDVFNQYRFGIENFFYKLELR